MAYGGDGIVAVAKLEGLGGRTRSNLSSLVGRTRSNLSVMDIELPLGRNRSNVSGAGDAPLTGSEALPARATAIRFLILVFAPGFMFGNFYFFDQTSAMQAPILAHTGMSPSTFGLLASVYSWPNVILPFFGGLIIDKIGHRVACVGFSVIVLVGSFIFTIGLWTNQIWLLIVGRIIFGMGGESQNVACLAIVSKWFVGRELAFGMAMCVAVSRVGSVAVFNSQPELGDQFGIVWASWAGFAICGLSLVSALLAALIDKIGDRRDAARGLDNEMLGAADLEPPAALEQLREIFNFGALFWLVGIACVSVYVAAFPFLQITSTPFLQGAFGLSTNESNTCTSIPNLVSAIASPIVGLLVDRIGHRPPLIVTSSAMFITTYVGFIIYPHTGSTAGIYALYALLGTALSFFGAVIWPCVPLVVEEERVGTAIGLTTAMQNLGMAVSPMVLTYLQGKTGGFTAPFLYIIACCCIGMCSGIAIWIIKVRRKLDL